ncbi:sugar-binding domain-containing protein, partial [bacterium]
MMKSIKIKAMRKAFCIVMYLIMICMFSCQKSQDIQSISLAGKWRFQTDINDHGIEAKWYSTNLKEMIRLPGSMRDSGKGEDLSLKTQWTGTIYDSSWYFNPHMEKYRQPGNLKFPFWLTPNKHYVGPAWYQRTVQIPKHWNQKRITLFLERLHWETTVWVDDKPVGIHNSLSTPHKYNLSALLTTGKHVITIRVDNRIKEINPGPDSHSLTDHTQGNWNGIIGEISLNADSLVYLNNIQLFPDINQKSVNVQMHIQNETQKIVTCTIQLLVQAQNSETDKAFKRISKTLTIIGDRADVKMNYPMGEEIELWDEFNPNLYTMKVELSAAEAQYDIQNIQFGMRQFAARGTRFEINGRPVFLRGTVECCVFPLTGYPPTDVNAWKHVFDTCRDHGLNHMRFHSWCPPKAAFIAADQTGFYLQVEGPSWTNHGTSLGDGAPIDTYIYEETQRILDAYGNHPSFCMMAYGNEPAGRHQVKYLGKYVNHFKGKDNRRLYTSASIGMSWPLVPENEFIVRSGPRGLPWEKRPESQFDYHHKIENADVPYIAHEMGQ